MPILESIAAASAAYEIIKTAINQGREGAGLIGAVGKFLGAEEDIKEAVQKKKNSPLTAITGGEEGMWEEFQALEQIREQRRELESYIRLFDVIITILPFLSKTTYFTTFPYRRPNNIC